MFKQRNCQYTYFQSKLKKLLIPKNPEKNPGNSIQRNLGTYTLDKNQGINTASLEKLKVMYTMCLMWTTHLYSKVREMF